MDKRKKHIDKTYVLDDEEYDIYVNHWITVEEYLLQKQESASRKLSAQRRETLLWMPSD